MLVLGLCAIAVLIEGSVTLLLSAWIVKTPLLMLAILTLPTLVASLNLSADSLKLDLVHSIDIELWLVTVAASGKDTVARAAGTLVARRLLAAVEIGASAVVAEEADLDRVGSLRRAVVSR